MYNVSSSGPRFTCEACALKELIMYAYNVNNYQVSIAPADARYDIIARAGGNTAPTKREFRMMLQSLLADRFQLRIHREAKAMPVFVLVAGKNGPKLKESESDGEPRSHTGVNNGTYQVTMRNFTVEHIASVISSGAHLDLPVLDKTGLTGTYDATLTYTPNWEFREGGPDLPGISIFDAVQKQLGLSLSRQKEMIEILVVDHVDKPSEN